MKRFWTACAALAAFVAAAGCNDYGNTFQVPTGARIFSISPSSVAAGSPGFTLTVTGAGFMRQEVVQWNGKTIPTTVNVDSSGNVIGSSITATVAASLVASQGTAFVSTLQPHSGAGTNGLSNPLPLIINPPPNPVPVVTGTSPSCAVAPAAAVTLTINGSSFLPTGNASGVSQVNWNAGPTQTALTPSSITSTQIQAAVPASLLAAPGSAIVSVYNPPSPQTAPPGQVPNPSAGGGGTSANSPTFTVLASGSTCPAGTTATTATAQSHVAQETPAVSADGRYVAYTGSGTANSEHTQIFVHDTCEGAPSGCQVRTMLISAASDGTEANDDSRSPSISADGRYVAFSSAATNLVSDAPAGRQVYVSDTCAGVPSGACTPKTELVSTDSAGALVGTESILPSISASGRFVAFLAVTPTHATNQASPQAKAAARTTVPNSGYRQVFVRDTCVGATNCTPKTTRISLNPSDTSSTGAKPAGPAVSGTGTHVALPDAASATVFTRGVPIDDRVFLALTNQ